VQLCVQFYGRKPRVESCSSGQWQVMSQSSVSFHWTVGCSWISSSTGVAITITITINNGLISCCVDSSGRWSSQDTSSTLTQPKEATSWIWTSSIIAACKENAWGNAWAGKETGRGHGKNAQGENGYVSAIFGCTGMSHILSHWHNFWRPAFVYSSMKIYCIQSMTKLVLCWTWTRFHWWRVKTIVHVLVTMDGPWKCCGRWRLQHRASQMSGHCWQFIQFMWWQGVVRGILDRATVWKQGMNSTHSLLRLTSWGS